MFFMLAIITIDIEKFTTLLCSARIIGMLRERTERHKKNSWRENDLCMSRMSTVQSAEEGGELLRTKLTPPRVRGPLVERETLFARLDKGLEQRVILLSAPAGSGKTTLIRAWMASRSEQGKLPPVAWVSLDAGENDPTRFWRYVLAACSVFQAQLGQQALELLHSSPQTPVENTLILFLNELAQLTERGLLVLEDYHTISSPKVHESLAFLLDYLPETLRVALITRADPPLPLARWRAHHELCELRAADLRFSLDETRGFLQQAIPFSLSPEMLTRLDRQIEGWAAGLRLLALALQGRQSLSEIERALATFSGGHQHILTYLVADVLNAQPQDLQLFLLQTSQFTRLTASLCDALTGRQDSAAVLAQLDQANLFLYPLDGAGQWYRYHALFAEAMRHEAHRRLGEEALHALSARASLWYEEHEQLPDAIETAFAARDFARAANLMEHLSERQFFQNEYYTLLRWGERLPEEQLALHPSLCLLYASALLYLTDRYAPVTWARMQHPLEMAERVWQEEGNTTGLGEIEALRASALMWQSDFAQSFQKARRALELLPEQEHLWRGICLIHVGLAELFAGRPDQARQALREALLINEASGNSHAVRASRFLLCEVSLACGELHLAEQVYQQLYTDAENAQDLTDVGSALGFLAQLAYEWNNLEIARQQITLALELARRFSQEDVLARASLFLARLLYARGEASQAMQRLTALAAQMQHRPFLLRDIYAGQARLALASGDLVSAQQQISASAQYSDADNFFHRQDQALLNARLLIAQNRPDEALILLSTWQAEAQERGLARSLLEILILQALAYQAQKETAQARQSLLRALALARPEGYQRLFLDEGPALYELLLTFLPGIHDKQLAAYARDLLQASAHEQAARASASAVPVAEPALIEQLSPQERRVLRLLAAGLSNPEIANELVVSVNTIKTQVQSIYYKLGVNSRQEAREAARRLRLV